MLEKIFKEVASAVLEALQDIAKVMEESVENLSKALNNIERKQRLLEKKESSKNYISRINEREIYRWQKIKHKRIAVDRLKKRSFGLMRNTRRMEWRLFRKYRQRG